jgi:hypothetical protein
MEVMEATRMIMTHVWHSTGARVFSDGLEAVATDKAFQNR